MSHDPVQSRLIIKKNPEGRSLVKDSLAVEEPLGIELVYQTATGLMKKNIAVTMRTPGHDEDLSIGFLFTEGIISDYSQIDDVHVKASQNIVSVILKENIIPRLQLSDRNFYTSSSCGICGKASMDAVYTQMPFVQHAPTMTIGSGILHGLQNTLKLSQHAFAETGGIHASALFDTDGHILLLREDVGRHNALDKLIGAAMKENLLPLHANVLLLSGRASFELIQKAAMAGIPIIAAVGAPSSLAVDMAEEQNITLIGFLRENRFNIYSKPERVTG